MYCYCLVHILSFVCMSIENGKMLFFIDSPVDTFPFILDVVYYSYHYANIWTGYKLNL
jgi:hypothetical protein